jgi:hypothetical protein
MVVLDAGFNSLSNGISFNLPNPKIKFLQLPVEFLAWRKKNFCLRAQQIENDTI